MVTTRIYLRNKFLPLFLLLSFFGVSQNYTITTGFKDVDCTKGNAGALIEGYETTDTVTYYWSNGESGVTSISNLPEGNYSVNIKVKGKLDTTLYIRINKLECPVVISNHFTPNGDLYNDTWSVSRTEYYPNFELYVFNKWGQKVHSQQGTYKPWDGTWAGVNVADGTYYYVFYYDGSDKNNLLKGDVTILR